MTKKELQETILSLDNPLTFLLETLNTLKDRHGFEQDLLTPGFLKEWLVSEILGHECHKTKHGPDAYSKDDEKRPFEYLSCKKGGSFQLDRIDDTNLHRIERNDKFFFNQFDKKSGLKCLNVWEVETDKVLKEATRKIKKMSKTSKHIGFTETWVKQNGKLVYSN